MKKLEMLEDIALDDAISTADVAAVYGMLQELKRARTIHPIWPKDNVHRVAIVNEEAGELVKAVLDNLEGKNCTVDDIHGEAVQTGAMCIRFISTERDVQ